MNTLAILADIGIFFLCISLSASVLLFVCVWASEKLRDRK
jgi:hypothetical protein